MMRTFRIGQWEWCFEVFRGVGFACIVGFDACLLLVLSFAISVERR